MDWIHALALALLQGITEFLPISSSAHLVLLPYLLGWQDQGLAFDVAVHVGSLIAVVAYFYSDLIQMFRAWWSSLTGGADSPESRLAWAVLIGTVPVGLAGLVFGDLVETHLRGPLPIAVATIVFGLLLWWADAWGRHQRDEHTIRWRDVLVVGCAQALALIPGTSRSGITITAALALGLTRAAAARFSFLLSIPAIALAGIWKAAQIANGQGPELTGLLFLGTVTAAVAAWFSIHFFLRLVERTGMLPFVIYRILLGAVLLVLYW